MDSNQPQPSRADDPASAFSELRREVSLLRRAVEGLTAERQNAPDYLPTLKAFSGRLAQIEEFMENVSDSPAMRLTPKNLAASIAEASETVRAGDCETVERAGATLRASIASIDGVVRQAWTADRQWKQLYWVAAGSLSLGVIAALSLEHLIG